MPRASRLRGDEGNANVTGWSGFDEISGNMGVRRTRQRQPRALDGQNLFYGDLDADTREGGGRNDIVRGGLGADIFQIFGDAGRDRVLDFDLAQRDRVRSIPARITRWPRWAPIRSST